MLIRTPNALHPRDSDVTPEGHYLNRRQLIIAMAGAASAATTVRAGALPAAHSSALLDVTDSGLARLPARRTRNLVEAWTSFDSITHYNNFVELGLVDKEGPAANAGSLRTRPWTVRVDGLVAKPTTFDIDKLTQLFPLEERVYRMRCVEPWSMVIPWIGFPLASLLKLVEPLGSAKFIAFQSLHDPDQMPGQRTPYVQWPYIEGLRLDEGLHPLTLIALGLYGRVLPNQNGAPARLVVPWKYGFKSIKSIVRIQLVEGQPPTTWNRESPQNVGFYSNVNPEMDNADWSQARERRVGELLMRPTLPFNGYADEVAGLYRGMDLRRYF